MEEAKQVGNDQFLTEMDIRMFLRDTNPEANFLILDYEFSGDEIVAAMTYAQDLWNEAPPVHIRGMDYRTTPFRTNLMTGAASYLLSMAGHRFRRNHVNHQAGGLSVNDQNKFMEYDRASQDLHARYMEWVNKIKVSINMSNCWGHTGSF